MAGIHELESQAQATSIAKQRQRVAGKETVSEKLSRYFSPDRWGSLTSAAFSRNSFATASIAMALVVVGVFYMGRLSVEPLLSLTVSVAV